MSLTQPVLDWKTTRHTGVHGTGVSVNWTPFDFTTYGYTTIIKNIVAYDFVAVATNETVIGTHYSQNYCGKCVYIWDPNSNAGFVIKNFNEMNDTVDLSWNNPTAVGLNGNLVFGYNGNPALTWDIFLSARIVSAILI